ncbi:MAG: CapA family protein, partial [Chloroflexota bacterium]|nr:CapA family protein [Chloroflexota bacterium]
GDILLDRGVARQVTVAGKGIDFPWNGGSVEIVRRDCCSPFGHRLPVARSTGNEGGVRRLISGADMAMANLESPVERDARYHAYGTTFTGDARLLAGLQNAGFDFLSLANNHIGDGGASAIRETVGELDRLGIAHAGAGRDVAAAAAPAYLDAAGQRVAIISCSVVGRDFASRSGAGGLRCRDEQTLEQIGLARAEADVVIVTPHWGREYQAEPSRAQRRLAASWLEAGADLVIGHHSHWAGAIEEIGGRLVFYSLGNLVFDQDWSEPTMQGLLLELTFNGRRLVQAWPHPTLIVEDAQPNLLDYEGGGRRVLERVRRASEGMFDY